MRMFMEKMEAANFRYGANILVVFIVNPEVEEEFDREIEAYEDDLKKDYDEL